MRRRSRRSYEGATRPIPTASAASDPTSPEGSESSSSWNRCSFHDVLHDRLGRQAVARCVRAEPDAVAEHVLRKLLNVFGVDLVAVMDEQRPDLRETAPDDDRERRRGGVDA